MKYQNLCFRRSMQHCFFRSRANVSEGSYKVCFIFRVRPSVRLSPIFTIPSVLLSVRPNNRCIHIHLVCLLRHLGNSGGSPILPPDHPQTTPRPPPDHPQTTPRLPVCLMSFHPSQLHYHTSLTNFKRGI